jgi:hypothetical protein
MLAIPLERNLRLDAPASGLVREFCDLELLKRNA